MPSSSKSSSKLGTSQRESQKDLQKKGAQRRCPVCKSEMSMDDLQNSFCSDRCKLVDLQKWFDGDYAIPGLPAVEEDENFH